MDNNQNSRFKRVVNHFFETQSAAAKALDVTDGYVSHLIKGRNSINGEIILNISIVLPGVNIDWLLHGRGEMLWSEYDASKNQQVNEPPLVYRRVGDDRVAEAPTMTLEELTAIVLRLSDQVRSMEEKVEDLCAGKKE